MLPNEAETEDDPQQLDEQRLYALRREIKVGLDQLDGGEGITYDEQSLKAMFDDIKQDCRIGRADLEQGRVVPGEMVFAELRERSAQKRKLL